MRIAALETIKSILDKLFISLRCGCIRTGKMKREGLFLYWLVHFLIFCRRLWTKDKREAAGDTGKLQSRQQRDTQGKAGNKAGNRAGKHACRRAGRSCRWNWCSDSFANSIDLMIMRQNMIRTAMKPSSVLIYRNPGYRGRAWCSLRLEEWNQKTYKKSDGEPTKGVILDNRSFGMREWEWQGFSIRRNITFTREPIPFVLSYYMDTNEWLGEGAHPTASRRPVIMT